MTTTVDFSKSVYVFEAPLLDANKACEGIQNPAIIGIRKMYIENLNNIRMYYNDQVSLCLQTNAAISEKDGQVLVEEMQSYIQEFKALHNLNIADVAGMHFMVANGKDSHTLRLIIPAVINSFKFIKDLQAWKINTLEKAKAEGKITEEEAIAEVNFTSGLNDEIVRYDLTMYNWIRSNKVSVTSDVLPLFYHKPTTLDEFKNWKGSRYNVPLLFKHECNPKFFKTKSAQYLKMIADNNITEEELRAKGLSSTIGLAIPNEFLLPRMRHVSKDILEEYTKYLKYLFDITAIMFKHRLMYNGKITQDGRTDVSMYENLFTTVPDYWWYTTGAIKVVEDFQRRLNKIGLSLNPNKDDIYKLGRLAKLEIGAEGQSIAKDYGSDKNLEYDGKVKDLDWLNSQVTVVPTGPIEKSKDDNDNVPKPPQGPQVPKGPKGSKPEVEDKAKVKAEAKQPEAKTEAKEAPQPKQAGVSAASTTARPRINSFGSERPISDADIQTVFSRFPLADKVFDACRNEKEAEKVVNNLTYLMTGNCQDNTKCIDMFAKYYGAEAFPDSEAFKFIALSCTLFTARIPNDPFHFMIAGNFIGSKPIISRINLKQRARIQMLCHNYFKRLPATDTWDAIFADPEAEPINNKFYQILYKAAMREVDPTYGGRNAEEQLQNAIAEKKARMNQMNNQSHEPSLTEEEKASMSPQEQETLLNMRRTVANGVSLLAAMPSQDLLKFIRETADDAMRKCNFKSILSIGNCLDLMKQYGYADKVAEISSYLGFYFNDLSRIPELVEAASERLHMGESNFGSDVVRVAMDYMKQFNYAVYNTPEGHIEWANLYNSAVDFALQYMQQQVQLQQQGMYNNNPFGGMATNPQMNNGYNSFSGYNQMNPNVDSSEYYNGNIMQPKIFNPNNPAMF